MDHPNIIAYKESFIDKSDGALCIVTSFCEEGDLFNKIRKRSAANQLFTENEVMDMFVQVGAWHGSMVVDMVVSRVQKSILVRPADRSWSDAHPLKTYLAQRPEDTGEFRGGHLLVPAQGMVLRLASCDLTLA